MNKKAEVPSPTPPTTVPPQHRPQPQPEPEVEVEELELEDLPAVFALGEQLFTSDRWPNLYRTWDEYEVINLFASDGDTCFVARCEDRIVGFALGAIIEKRRNPWKYGYLIWIGVDDKAPIKGVGQKLMRTLTHRFIELGARMMLVDTDAENQRAIDFFKRNGFGNVQHHIYMTRNLTLEPDYHKFKNKKEHESSKKKKKKKKDTKKKKAKTKTPKTAVIAVPPVPAVAQPTPVSQVSADEGSEPSSEA